MTKISYLVVLVLLPCFLLGQSEESNDAIQQRIDAYLQQSVTNGYFASVLVAKEDEVLLKEGYGWAGREDRIPITSETVFNIGSVTKQFTAIGILKLVEEGKLNLLDSLSSFYDALPDPMRGITIHQLLTHTSGIANSTGGFRYDEASKERFLRECFAAPLWTTPGTTHQYANANYILLADIIEKASGTSYETYLHDNFWEPTGMKYTGYTKFAADSVVSAEGNYYNYTDGEWRDWGVTSDYLPQNGNHWYSIGKGDLQSNVEDLYRWHSALESNRILAPASKKLMEFPHVPENAEGTSHYGYGWAIYTTKSGKKVVWHNGSNGIYFATFLRFVDQDLVIIVLSNTILNPDSENVAWEIAKMVDDSSYIPEPVTPLSYEVVHTFMNNHSLEEIQLLPEYLSEKTHSRLPDKALFNRMGFRFLEDEKEKGWGLALLQLNTQLYPNDGNLWDSMGEGYLHYSMNEKASQAFEKALELAPDAECGWCDNAKKKLEKLRNGK